MLFNIIDTYLSPNITPINYLGETSDVLQEATVTIIDNYDCSRYLKENTTNHAIRKAQVQQTLQNGINGQLICSMGIFNETTKVYTVYIIRK